MPQIGLLLSARAAGFVIIVRTNDECGVGLRKGAVDFVHIERLVLRNVGFGKQHVHVAGHAPGDRMNAEFPVDATFHSESGQSRALPANAA